MFLFSSFKMFDKFLWKHDWGVRFLQEIENWPETAHFNSNKRKYLPDFVNKCHKHEIFDFTGLLCNI